MDTILGGSSRDAQALGSLDNHSPRAVLIVACQGLPRGLWMSAPPHYTWVFDIWFLGRAGIADLGVQTARLARSPFQPVGRLAAHQIERFVGQLGLPAPQKLAVPPTPPSEKRAASGHKSRDKNKNRLKNARRRKGPGIVHM